MNILITGIHGFVGSNLVESLKDNNTIYGLDIITPTIDGVKKTFTWDELTLGSIPEIDAIIHLAGKAHDTKNKSEAKVYFDINTGLTQKIFDYFLDSTAKKFIFFSSVKAAADSVIGDILTEDVKPNPIGPYGESKIKAEDYILSMVDELEEKNKSFIILRPCMIHGPGNKGNLNLLYSLIKKGIPWPLGSFDNSRSFTSIDNLKFAISKILVSDIRNGIYHIGDDEPISTNELIRIICSSIDKKARVLNIPKGLIRFFASIGDILHLPLNSDKLKKLTENYVVSNEKLKKELGITNFPISSKHGLEITLKSFQIK